jgi:hypothetical protein
MLGGTPLLLQQLLAVGHEGSAPVRLGQVVGTGGGEARTMTQMPEPPSALGGGGPVNPGLFAPRDERHD